MGEEDRGLGDGAREGGFGEDEWETGRSLGDGASLSLRRCVISASGFALDARPVAWMTLACLLGSSVGLKVWMCKGSWDKSKPWTCV